MVSRICSLIWKDLLLRWNQFLMTVLEIVLPILFTFLINAGAERLEHTSNPTKLSMNGSNSFQEIIYEPPSNFATEVMSEARRTAGLHRRQVLSDNIENPVHKSYNYGIKFQNEGNTLKNFTYTFYPRSPHWEHMYNLKRKFGEVNFPEYEFQQSEDLLLLQNALAKSFGKSVGQDISLQQVIFTSTDFESRNPVLLLLLFMVFLLSFSFLVTTLVSRIINEKATGVKELMLMMGVRRYELWGSKFIDTLFINIIVISAMVLILFVPLYSGSYVFLYVSPIFMWSYLVLGYMGFVMFLFFLSCFFGSRKKSLFAIHIFWISTFALYFWFIILKDEEISQSVQYLFCVLPHLAFLRGLALISDFESYRKNINFTEVLTSNDSYMTLFDVTLMLVLDVILYAILTWYVDHLRPGKYGVPQSPLFFLNSSFWGSNKIDVRSKGKNSDSNADVESAPDGLTSGISVQNVTKVYNSAWRGSVTAVQDVSIEFYRGEISSLLGHNGAGKTTMFSMITGMAKPSYGRILLRGCDVSFDQCNAREGLGFCPQDDMLFEDLTTAQTLHFFGMLKGLNSRDACDEACHLISKLKLLDVQHTRAGKLSGGQKRKLSLGIALIGRSETIILDEPTSGMDPEVRRDVWELLLSLRESKTILLTTHFMEEADALSDRIAIMDHGEIKCYGTPMYLKSKYGTGYVLVVVTKNNDKIIAVKDCVKKHLESAQLKSRNGQTLTYSLPDETHKFSNLLNGIQRLQNEGDVVSYSLSLCTLEDVFLKVGEKEESGDVVDGAVPYSNLQSCEEDQLLVKGKGFPLLLLQIYALLIKRTIHFSRNILLFCVYSVIPLTIVALVIAMEKLSWSSGQTVTIGNDLPFSLDSYGRTEVLYSSSVPLTNFEKFINRSNSVAIRVPNVTEEFHRIFFKDYRRFRKNLAFAVEFNPDYVAIYHNWEMAHAVPIALNAIHNAFLVNTTIMPSISNKYIHQEKREFSHREEKSFNLPYLLFLICAQTLFYVLSPAEEKAFGAKDLQLMLVPSVIFWAVHLSFDSLTFWVYETAILLMLSLSNDESFKSIWETFAIGLWLCGLGMILVNYIIVAVSKSRTSAIGLAAFVFILGAFGLDILTFTGLIPQEFKNLYALIILKSGLFDYYYENKSDFICCLIVFDVLMFAFLILLESKICERLWHSFLTKASPPVYDSVTVEEDNKVLEEGKLVRDLQTSGKLKQKVLVVDALKRWYGSFKKKPAVRGVSFTVAQGECFGLLGVNGAGKTSTFNMLTGILNPSHGNAFIEAVPLSSFNSQTYTFRIGYCPQAGRGFIPSFTGYEMLQLFSRLKGFRGRQATKEVRRLSDQLNLTEYLYKRCGEYSGGNKRKLSTAIAFLGEPSIVFLDEPTSGVDPISRRCIWKAISATQVNEQSVVLTSHSMDECEALCTRIAIMISGRFRCLGETAVLKKNYGQGHSVQLKISPGASSEELKRAVQVIFGPGCKLTDEHLTIVQYHITNPAIKLPDLFERLEGLKNSNSILESYTASSTSLEEIFMYFARSEEIS